MIYWLPALDDRHVWSAAGEHCSGLERAHALARLQDASGCRKKRGHWLAFIPNGVIAKIIARPQE